MTVLQILSYPLAIIVTYLIWSPDGLFGFIGVLLVSFFTSVPVYALTAWLSKIGAMLWEEEKKYR